MDYVRMAARTAVLVSLVGIGLLVASPASAQGMPPPLPEPSHPDLEGLISYILALVQRLLEALL
jgi:hypothetical protein